MKKILSVVLASMVAVAFAGITCAAEPATTTMDSSAPTEAAPAKSQVKKHHHKKHNKKHHRKHHKKEMKAKEGSAPEVPMAPSSPEAPPAN